MLKISFSPTRRKEKLSDKEWWGKICSDPAYSDLSLEREYGKAKIWLETNAPQRKMTRRYFLNWINRAEIKAGGLMTIEKKKDDAELIRQLDKKIANPGRYGYSKKELEGLKHYRKEISDGS